MENIGERQEYEFIDLTEETLSEQTQERPHGRYQYKRVARNGSLECTHRARSVYKFGDDDLKLGTCIELREPFGKWEVCLQGFRFENLTDCFQIDTIRRNQINLGLKS